MNISKDSGRQNVKYAEVVVNLNDVSDGAAKDAIDLPLGASVVGGDLVVDTAFDAGTTATLSVGDASSATRYLNAQNVKVTGRTALTITGFKTTISEQTLQVKYASSGTAATAGKARLRVMYVVDGRVDENQD